MRHARLPCVIGGDHSCAGGTWTGVARMLQGELGLVWIDAHMDSHTPATSHTGRLHGMPLAWLLGQGDDALYGLSAGVVDPEHVALIGVRSYEPEEKERLDRLGVRVFHIEEVHRRGLDTVAAEALAIAARGTSGFGVSIDLDAVTPEEAPGVGTPVADGIAGAAARARAAQLSAPGPSSSQSSSSSICRASIPTDAAPAWRWSSSPPPYAGRATIRRSSPRRSTETSLSRGRSSRARTAGRSSMPCAPSPRKLGLR